MNDAMRGADLARYELRVREALADLPADEVEELVQDLRAHLADVNAEFRDGLDEDALADRLGPPGEYAAELRTAAGFAPSDATPVRVTLRDRIAGQVARVREFPWPGWVVGAAPYARYTWWVTRGWLAGYLVAIQNNDAAMMAPVPDLHRSDGWIGLILIVVGIAGSIALGRVLRGKQKRWWLLMMPVNAAVVIGLLVLSFQYRSYEYYPDPSQVATDEALIGPGGSSITNVYLFDPTGKPIPEAYLYDQDGRPIDLLRAHCGTADFRMDNRFPRPQVISDTDETTGEGTCRENATIPFRATIPAPAPTVSPVPIPTPTQ